MSDEPNIDGYRYLQSTYSPSQRYDFKDPLLHHAPCYRITKVTAKCIYIGSNTKRILKQNVIDLHDPGIKSTEEYRLAARDWCAIHHEDREAINKYAITLARARMQTTHPDKEGGCALAFAQAQEHYEKLQNKQKPITIPERNIFS